MKLQRSSFSGFFQQLDFFGENLSFREDKKNSFTTNCGAILSLLIMMLVAIYGQKKFVDMIDREDALIQVYTEKKSFKQNAINLNE